MFHQNFKDSSFVPKGTIYGEKDYFCQSKTFETIYYYVVFKINLGFI